MATDLRSFNHKKGLIIYLDTSAVLPMASSLAGQLRSPDKDRHARLIPFLQKAANSQSRIVCSILALEEIGAKFRREGKEAARRREGHNDWRTYEQANPGKAAQDLALIRDWVLKMLEFAARALGENSVSVEQPVVTDALVGGRELRKAHREFLRLYPTLDAMDALHIAYGAKMGCKHFVSFDNGWQPVSEIELLN